MPTDDNRPNTLGMRERELEGLLQSMEAGAAQHGHPNAKDRLYSRWQFRQRSVEVRILQPGGTETVTQMACRNLSKGGIGLLHRSYVHIGTRCIVTIPHPSKGDQEHHGKVVRCLHFSGMVHEIGIAFDEDIPLREITRPDPMQEIFAVEHVEAESLVGTLLLVEDSDMDVKLVKHFLRGTQVRVKHAENLADAEKLVKTGVGLVLCDIHLGGENGGDFAKRLADTMSNRPPVVMTSADRAESTYTLINKPYIKGFLAKPYSQDSLLRTVSEFMVDPGAAEAMRDANGVRADPQIVSVLLPELTKACGKLQEAVGAEDPTRTLALLMQLAGIAPVLGLDDLAGMTETMGQQLAGDMDLARISAKLDDIVRLCDQAAGRAG